MDFDAWLANLLGHSADEVATLLRDKTATQFLMAWSIFESKCFNGFVKFDKIEVFSRRVVNEHSFDNATVLEAASHFHDRYRDDGLYRNLMHGQNSKKMVDLLKQSFQSLAADEVVFLALVTTYRYRNNIFHGNKKVHSWLRFKSQIERCTSVMQELITHSESMTGSLRTPTAA